MRFSKKYLVVSALAVIVGFLGFSNDAQAKEDFKAYRYDIPETLQPDTYVPGLGYYFGYNGFGQGVFCESPVLTIVIGGEKNENTPYSVTEIAVQEYVYYDKEGKKYAKEYGYKHKIEDVKNNMSSYMFSDDLMADLFDNTKTERSQAFKVYINLAEQGYRIDDIFCLMQPLNYSDELMQDLFYSTYHPEAFVGPKF